MIAPIARLFPLPKNLHVNVAAAKRAFHPEGGFQERRSLPASFSLREFAGSSETALAGLGDYPGFPFDFKNLLLYTHLACSRPREQFGTVLFQFFHHGVTETQRNPTAWQ
jgi:hypothetical protein